MDSHNIATLSAGSSGSGESEREESEERRKEVVSPRMVTRWDASCKRQKIIDRVYNRERDPSSISVYDGTLSTGEFFNEDEFSDVLLKVNHGEYTLPSHKIVLCSQSGYFRSMFSGPWRENTGSEPVFIEVQPQYTPVLRPFFRYLYTGNIEMDKYTVWLYYFLADRFLVDRLQGLCNDYMIKNLKVMSKSRAYSLNHGRTTQLSTMGTFTVGEAYDIFSEFIDEKVRTAVGDFILANIHKVQDQDWVDLEKPLVVSVLKGSICNKSEVDLYQYAVNWLQHAYDKRKDYADEVLSCIRYCYIESPNQLYTIERSHQKKSGSNIYCSKISQLIASACHWKLYKEKIGPEAIQKIQEFQKSQYQQR